MGAFRLVALYFLKSFDSTIAACARKKEDDKNDDKNDDKKQ